MATFNGTAGNDTLTGTPEDDFLQGLSGDDTLAGGDGVDTAIQSAAPSGYRLAVTEAGVLSLSDTDPGNGDEGADHLQGIERLQFSDRTWRIQTEFPDVLRLNTITSHAQFYPQSVTLRDGNIVVVWVSGSYPWWAEKIQFKGQVYSPVGAPVGDEFLITMPDNQYQDMSIAPLADGGFVVAGVYQSWTNGPSFWGQRFDDLASPVGERFAISSDYPAQGRVELTPLSQGGFAAVWGTPDGEDIRVRRFDANGVAGAIVQASVNAVIEKSDTGKAVSLSDGSLVVAWTSWLPNGNSYAADIKAQRYTADGKPAGSIFRINTAGMGDQNLISLSSLDSGRWVALWSSVNTDPNQVECYARIFNSDGTPYGNEWVFNAGPARNAGVALTPGGGFSISWVDAGNSGVYQIMSLRFDAEGLRVGDVQVMGTTSGFISLQKGLTALPDGRLLVTNAINYDEGGMLVPDIHGSILHPGSRPSGLGETTALTGSALGDPLLLQTSVAPLSIHGAGGDDILAGGDESDQLDGGSGYDTVLLQGNPQDYRFRLEASGRMLVADIDAADGQEGVDTLLDIEQLQFADRSWQISRVGNQETQVNVRTADSQFASVIATLDNGGLVVAWTSANQDGSGYGIYARCYSAAGTPVGSEFLVNERTDSGQWSPAVTSLGHGQFAVSWTSQDDVSGSLESCVYVRRFDNDGNPMEPDRQLNTTIAGDQGLTALSALPDGGWVAVWQSGGQDGAGEGIFGQRFSASGQKQGPEFQVNTFTLTDQRSPAVTTLAHGGFVVVWASQQGNAYEDVYGQRYAADGTALGGEFRINTYTSVYQRDASVSALSDGGFVVTWTSFVQDGSGDGVFGQRFNADGSTQGSEFRINSYNFGDQRVSAVQGLSDGGFVVVWTTPSLDGSGDGVYAKRFDAAGNSVTGDVRLNGYTAGNQGSPKLSALEDGGFAATWYSWAQDGDQGGVYAQRFDAACQPLGLGELKLEGSALDDALRLPGSLRPLMLLGLDGNDTLEGGLGQDVLAGGRGDDVYRPGAGDQVLENSGEGFDTVRIASDFVLAAANVEGLVLEGNGSFIGTGNELDNTLTGNAAVNKLYGLGGNDILDGGAGVDYLLGGAGNDTYRLDVPADAVSEAAGEGVDTVVAGFSYTLGANVENLMLTGYSIISANGNGLNNILTGNLAGNVLRGNGGADTMMGGAGDDRYYVDSADDIVLEDAGEGNDYVYSTVSLTLGANVERLYLQEGSAQALEAIGNNLNNTLTGNSLGNTLRGNGGADTLTGRGGNDRYYVDSMDDIVEEYAGEGTDEVYSSVSHTLRTNVENLTLLDTAQAGSGNGLDNIIGGNSSDNTLSGGAGNDVLHGMEGNDLLDGGSGTDAMTGGAGDDTYRVDSVADVVSEMSGEGTDTLQSSLTWTLGANLENLMLTGTAVINGHGNSANNLITGNSAGNTLKGNGGTDTLIGGGGDDRYYVDSADDTVTEQADEGADYVYSTVSISLGANLERLYLQEGFATALEAVGNSGDNTLTGNSLNNVLRGNGGRDTLSGRGGDDRYEVDSTDDMVEENAGEGTDEVISSVSYALRSNLENLTLTGAALEAWGNSLGNVLKGNNLDNTLSGGGGADTLSGGLGNDSYVVDNNGDVVIELLGEGLDTVQSSISYALGAHVENLVLTETSNLAGTGNELDNVLTGNSGRNRLNGGAGADILSGGLGDDTYMVDQSGDVMIEAADAGTDTVESAVTLTLGANLENLTLTGTALINGYGNALSNRLTGNSANNVLKGNGGTDTIIGGAGDDRYYVDSVDDMVSESAGEGSDYVYSSVSFTLGQNLERLYLQEGYAAALEATGNSSDNMLTGNSLNNVFRGNGGADTFSGRAGDDRYYVDSVDDVIEESVGEGLDEVFSTESHTLRSNVENLTLTGDAALNGTGNNLANLLTGNAGNNLLTGGRGNDTYTASRGMGADTLVENDSTSGNTDFLNFLTGVAHTQLWFTHAGNNLEVSIIGTNDKAVVKDWYLGAANRVERVSTVDGGKILQSTAVEALVTAMAGLTPPALGQTSLTAQQQAVLEGVIAASWS